MRLVCLRTRSFTNDYRHSLMIHPPVNSVSRTDRRITYLWPLCLRPFQLLADSPCTGSSPRSLLICDQRSQPRSGPLTPVRAHSWLPDLTGLPPPASSTRCRALRVRPSSLLLLPIPIPAPLP